MNARIVRGLLILTVLSVSGAVWSILQAPDAQNVAHGQIAFPVLRDNPDAVSRLVLISGEAEFNFERNVGTTAWQAGSKHDYPADPGRIREIVTELADMRLVEAKTRLPERFTRIGVESPDQAGSTSALLRLEDKTGRRLADVILGQRVWRQTGTSQFGTFIRFPSEDRAWLASGGLDLPADLISWLDRLIVDIDADMVTKATIETDIHPMFVIARGSPDEDFALSRGDGPVRINQSEAEKLSKGFAGLTFDDVTPLAETTLPETLKRVTAETFDGLSITIEFGTTDGQTSARLSATGNDAAAREEATEINSKLAPWVYRIADWRRARLDVTMEGLTADPS